MEEFSNRRDSVPLSVKAKPVLVTDEGYRVYEGTAGFGDIVQDYPDLVPPVAEFRPADEALHPETLASAEGKPITYDHPEPHATPEGMVIPETVKKLSEGTLLRAWGEDGKFRVRLIVHTPELQREIENGGVDLSLGYRQMSDQTPGSFGGRKYDRIQRGIRINHLAVIPKGGSARAIRPDGTHARLDSPQKTSKAVGPATYSPKEVSTMDKLSDAGKALLAQLSEADRAVLGPIMGAPAEASPAPVAAEAEKMKAEDEAQDAKMLAPILERLAAVEAAIKEIQGGKMEEKAEEAAEVEATEDSKMKGARKDSISQIDLEKVVKEAETRALAAIEQKQRFIESVRTDGHKANTADEAAAVMLSVVKENLQDLHSLAVSEHKAGRFDSLTQIYKSADTIRRNSLLAQQAAAVVGAPVTRQEPLFTLPM